MTNLRVLQLLMRRGLILVAALLVLMGAAVLHATAFPDRPVLAFVLSLASGGAATVVLTRLGRDPF